MKLSAPLLSFVPPRPPRGLPAISAFVLALALGLGAPGTASAEAPPKGAPSAEAKEPQAAPTKDQAGAQSFEEVDRMIAAAVDTTGEPQKKALEALGRLGPDAIPALTKKLHELRKERQGGVFAAVKLVKEANSGKLAPEGGDLVDGLLKVGRSDGGGYKATLSIALCLRVLAKIGTTPALKPLVHVAAYHDGALRPEVTRVVKALGEKAVPALIGLRRSDQDLRRWAVVTLEGMGKRVPGDAVQTTNGEL